MWLCPPIAQEIWRRDPRRKMALAMKNDNFRPNFSEKNMHDKAPCCSGSQKRSLCNWSTDIRRSNRPVKQLQSNRKDSRKPSSWQSNRRTPGTPPAVAVRIDWESKVGPRDLDRVVHIRYHQLDQYPNRRSCYPSTASAVTLRLSC